MDSVYVIAENVAYLNYNIQEEVLFVIHHVDTTVSVSGVAILQKFREVGFSVQFLMLCFCQY